MGRQCFQSCLSVSQSVKLYLGGGFHVTFPRENYFRLDLSISCNLQQLWDFGIPPPPPEDQLGRTAERTWEGGPGYPPPQRTSWERTWEGGPGYPLSLLEGPGKEGLGTPPPPRRTSWEGPRKEGLGSPPSP